ncbi:hypothetical protein EJD97_012243 [Solanum chilense]|uniref:Protein kinase domain-containing protein n=1 Tax=Solanum chilense TaxID=4083 RepID=A0A6N2BDQ4_SOLCI|nr:hypothetical protein EJD97_012243 [Solanum chilense]
MYLNSTQQTNCLTKMNDEGNGIDVSGCGVEKLTKTGSSYSDFTVDDVNMKFGDKLRKLSYNCQFQDTADKRGHLCEFCVNSWKDIKEQKQPVNFAYTEEKEQEQDEHLELTGKHKFRPAIDLAMPKDSSLEVSIEEVYSATNNLNESHFIGEGTAAKSRVLSWTQRLEIAIDSAKGLPTNILLGQNFEAKLSDFGFSKVIDIDESYMISEVRGTYGYVEPEYETNHHVNSGGDVYSFGIVLLQILSGRKVINMNMEKPTRLDKIVNKYPFHKSYHSLHVEDYTDVDKYLSFQAKSLLRERRAVEFVDPKLYGDYSTDAFQLTLELAISCIAPKQQRPSIEKVVDKLEEALAFNTSLYTSVVFNFFPRAI